MRSTGARRLRNFDTEHPFSYLYELPLHHHLESAANVHTAADLHVHSKFSNRADLESRECREPLRNTRRSNSRNGFHVAPLSYKSVESLRIGQRRDESVGNVLKLRTDSEHSRGRHNPRPLSKIF